MANAFTRLALASAAALPLACSQAEPLSITLINPKTNSVMRCAARQAPAAADVSLSSIVELCAKQLEARGFIRVDEKNATQFINK